MDTAMTAKLEICAAHDNFVAATYTPDRTASVTATGFSAFDAVANLRVYLQPFGYELPNVEITDMSSTVTWRGMLNGQVVSERTESLSPISECESAVDAIFAQEGFTGHGDIDFVRAILKDAKSRN